MSHRPHARRAGSAPRRVGSAPRRVGSAPRLAGSVRRLAGSVRRLAWQGAVAVLLASLVVGRGPTDGAGIPDPAVLGLLYVAAVTGELIRVDLAELRLPDSLTVPGFGFCVVGLGASWSGGGRPPLDAAVAGIAVGAFFLVLNLAGGLGMGDVKLGALLGLAAGALDGPLVFRGVLIACVAAGAAALILLAAARFDALHRIPFGPFLLLGFWSSIALP